MNKRLLSLIGYGAGVALLVHRSRPTVVSTTDRMVPPPPERQRHQDVPTRQPVHVETAAPAAPEVAPTAAEAAPKGLWGYVKGTFGAFLDDDCMTLGAAVAYYTVFSLPPLLLLIISVAGLVFGRAAVQGEIQNQMGSLVGGGAAGQVQTMVASAGSHPASGVLGIIVGAVVLVIGATGAFAALQDALNKTWHVKPDPDAGGVKAFLLKRVLSFGMILGVAFLLLVSLAVSAALSALGGWVSAFLPGVLSGPLLHAAGEIASFIVIALLFASIYKFLPDARIAWREVWVGAAVTGLLFTLGKAAIGLYLGKSGATSAYGAAGSVMLIVLWLYYACLIFLLGAEFTKLWASGHGRAIVPEPGAVRVETEERRVAGPVVEQ